MGDKTGANREWEHLDMGNFAKFVVSFEAAQEIDNIPTGVPYLSLGIDIKGETVAFMELGEHGGHVVMVPAGFAKAHTIDAGEQ